MKQTKLILTRTALLLFVMFMAQSVWAAQPPKVNLSSPDARITISATVDSETQSVTLLGKKVEAGVNYEGLTDPYALHVPFTGLPYKFGSQGFTVKVEFNFGNKEHPNWQEITDDVKFELKNTQYPVQQTGKNPTVTITKKDGSTLEWDNKEDAKTVTKYFVIDQREMKFTIGPARTRYYNGQSLASDQFAMLGTAPGSYRSPEDPMGYTYVFSAVRDSWSSGYVEGQDLVNAGVKETFIDVSEIVITRTVEGGTELPFPGTIGGSGSGSGITIPDLPEEPDPTPTNYAGCFKFITEANPVTIYPLPIYLEVTGAKMESGTAAVGGPGKVLIYDGNLKKMNDINPTAKQSPYTIKAYSYKLNSTYEREELVQVPSGQDGIFSWQKDTEYKGEKSDYMISRLDNGTTPQTMAADKFKVVNTNFVLVTDDPEKAGVTVTNGYIKIDQRPITIATASLGTGTEEDPIVYYDGKPHTKAAYEITSGTKLVEKETLVLKFTGSQTDPGSSKNTVDEAATHVMREIDGVEKRSENEEGVSNYMFSYDYGDLIVTSPKVYVTITGHNATKPYGGSYYVSGYDVAISNPAYKESDFTFSGTAEVSASEVGTTYMLLKKSQFTNTSTVYTDVEFNVTDGYITIDYYNATLADDEDNATLLKQIVNKYGGIANVTLDRTFATDGCWNTICLPFAVDLTAAGCPLADADVRELTEAAFADGTLTLNFTEVEAMEAGKPYVIKWDEGEGADATTLVFQEAEVSRTLTPVVFELGEGQSVTFTGTYAPVEFKEADKSVLLVGASNKLYSPAADSFVNAQRAYFQLEGLDEEAAESITMRFGDATVINSLQMNNVANEYYDLSGRRVAEPTKGIYIVNGKKVVIK